MDESTMDNCCVTIWKKMHPKLERNHLGKSKSIRILSIKRPFMRSLHASWFCFFVAFTSWFGIQPLLPTIRKELGLTKIEVANSGIASIAATIAVRITVGPLCDKFGPRHTMSSLLIIGSVPMALAGLVKTGNGLIILRLCVGILGGTFVPCQFWTTAMFSSKVIGTANAIVGGWGNLGGGFTFLLMPGIFELIKTAGADEYLAWKIAVCIPALVCIITGISIIFTTDDCPQGKWKNRILPSKNIKNSLRDPDMNRKQDNVTVKLMKGLETQDHDEKRLDVSNKTENYDHLNAKCINSTALPECNSDSTPRTPIKTKCWTYITIAILIIQYGCCFGVEIATNTVMNLYLLYRFKVEGCVENEIPETTNYASFMNTTLLHVENETINIVNEGSVLNRCSVLNQNTASLIASLFGLMNLFARALGGIFSDILRKYRGVAGRLLALFICLVCEGVMLIVFGSMANIPSAVVAMIFFSVFVQMSEGATYAVVPYVLPRRVGVVAGLVGAGGNAGALAWNTIWTQLVTVDPSRWFFTLGVTVICCSFLSSFTVVQGERIWHVFRSSKMSETERQK